MPQNVWFAKNGTVCQVGSQDLLGTFKSAKAELTVKQVEHNGPHDIFEQRTPIRKGLNITIDAYNPATGDSILALAGKIVQITMDVITGETISGEFLVGNVNSSGSEEAGQGSISLSNRGQWTGPGGENSIG